MGFLDFLNTFMRGLWTGTRVNDEIKPLTVLTRSMIIIISIH